MHILALDIDIAVVRAAVLDVATARLIGQVVAVEYKVEHPTPEAAEVSADCVWSAVTAAARSVAQAVEGIKGVSLCVTTPALVLLDEKDRPAARIRLPDDRRARAAARQVQAEVGAELLADTGNPPLPGLISALNFRQMLGDDPYLIREVRRYLHLNSWLALHLTGNAAFDPTNASLTGVYGTRTNRSWSSRWCEYFEVDPAWLPELIDGAATVGTIRSAVAAELGVPAGLPVKIGSSGMSMMMHAARMKAGDLFLDLGDPQQLAVRIDYPRADGRRLVTRFGVGEGCVEMAFNPIGPRALRWIHALCFLDQTEEIFRQQTISQALKRETRVTFDPPFLTSDSLGIMSIRAAFRDLTLSADRMDLVTALVAEMKRRHETALRTLSQAAPIQRVFVVGSDAEFMIGLLPPPTGATVDLIEGTPLTAVASLFN